MATLWMDRKPCEFLMKCGASSFKIIQTSKGRRKLVAYFENWETTLRALDTPQFFVPDGKSDNNLDRNQPKKKDNSISSKKVSKSNNQEEKHPNTQKKTKNSLKKKSNNKDNKAVLAEILTLLQKLV
ncbi:hypothetical protein GLOIN_2v1641446 [Rhizophagus irregularis DAOM 181602=DAOM 197198]|nr:hypothetical protein GLOIN_2v1641446 [Rhizophagus irregularis DAOM 181602=DAOM 197198]